MITMEIDLTKQFEMQKQLDDYIIKKHKINLLKIRDDRILSVMDEICELMNKMRFHKYWSKNKNPKVGREDLLEEYVDTWHFILSIGNEIEIPQVHYGLDIRRTFSIQFRAAVFVANDIYTPIGWTLFVSIWKGLGYMLKFTPEEVAAAYEKKYKENFERQDNDY